MKSKSLESLLASESGLHSEMVTRFQKLRDFKLLSNARGRNAEFLNTDEVVSGILSMVASKPGFAATTAIGLRNLKPVGAREDAFAKAETLAAALKAVLEDSTLLAAVKTVRLGDSDPLGVMATSAEIAYVEAGEIRITQYVPATAFSLFHKGKEKGFDRHSLNKQSVANETVVMSRLLVRIAQQMKDAIPAALERLEQQGCWVSLDSGVVSWPKTGIKGRLTEEMIEDTEIIHMQRDKK